MSTRTTARTTEYAADALRALRSHGAMKWPELARVIFADDSAALTAALNTLRAQGKVGRERGWWYIVRK